MPRGKVGIKRVCTPAQQQLATDNLKLAYFLAHRYWLLSDKEVDKDEMESEAIEQLVVAAAAYKPEMGIPFGAFASLCLGRRLVQYARRTRGKKHQTYSLDGRIVSKEGNPSRFSKDDFESHPDKKAPVATKIAEDRDECDSIKRVLHPRYWKVLKMIYMDGMRLEDVGKKFGVSKEAIRQNCLRAVYDVKKRLGVRT